jgi:hypothetical protein
VSADVPDRRGALERATARAEAAEREVARLTALLCSETEEHWRTHGERGAARAEVARLQALLDDDASDLESLRADIEEHLPAYVLDDGTDEEANHGERVEYAGRALRIASLAAERLASRLALAMAWRAAACEDVADAREYAEAYRRDRDYHCGAGIAARHALATARDEGAAEMREAAAAVLRAVVETIDPEGRLSVPESRTAEALRVVEAALDRAAEYGEEDARETRALGHAHERDVGGRS